jgi:hypothetical protein
MAGSHVATPHLWPLRTPTFYEFAEAQKHTFSWDSSGFHIRKNGVWGRTLHSFPRTEVGWADAWTTMAGKYPLLAEAVAVRTTALEAAHDTSEAAPRPVPTSSEPARWTPSGVLVLGSMLGWGPWSAGIGLWLTFGNSGYTIQGQSSSTSAVHAVCQAGATASQPGICGSVDLHWAFGITLIVVGVVAFLSGIVGLFVLQQRNPQAWRRAGGPIIAGLVLGIFAVLVNVARAIARAVKAGDAGAGPIQQPALAGVGASPSIPSVSHLEQPEPVQIHWRAGGDTGWEWLATDGKWYPQESAPPGAVPPGPPPPSTTPADT